MTAPSMSNPTTAAVSTLTDAAPPGADHLPPRRDPLDRGTAGPEWIAREIAKAERNDQ